MGGSNHPREELLLGVDVGTTGVKAVLFGVDGHIEGTGQAEYEIQHIRPAWVEQRPDDWWLAVCHAVRQALDGVTHGADRTVAMAVSSQAPAMLPLDRAGNVIRPALIWMDRRAEAEAVHLAENIGFEPIVSLTGNRPDAFYVAAKLLWYKRHEPESLARTAQFVQVNGYINYKLTGALSIDPAHASLLQLRDRSTGTWSPALCDACGVEPHQFPDVTASHQVIGEVTRDAARTAGLRPGLPVVTGTVDSAAAGLETGVIGPGLAAEMTGTSTVMLIPNTTGACEPAFIAMTHALPNLHLHLAAIVASGASLRWFRQEFGPRDAGYEQFTSAAATAPAGSNGVIFLPYMMGERSPLWDTNARGVFFGLSLATTRAEIVRAILEGSAFALRHNKDVAAHAGLNISELRSVGGGARSDLWNQIKADVLGIPIAVPEAAAGAPFGDAILAGMGAGLYTEPGKAIQSMVKIRRRYEPAEERHERYGKFYEIYRRIYDHLREDFGLAASVVAANEQREK